MDPRNGLFIDNLSIWVPLHRRQSQGLLLPSSIRVADPLEVAINSPLVRQVAIIQRLLALLLRLSILLLRVVAARITLTFTATDRLLHKTHRRLPLLIFLIFMLVIN